jgi:hypothetical protein
MQTPIVIALFAGGALVAWLVLLARRGSRRLAEVARTRNAQDSAEKFKAALPEVPEPFRSEMYGLIQRMVPRPSFPVHPDDDIWVLYDFDQGTLESEIEDYLVTRDEVLPHPKSCRGIKTVVEVVRMVALNKVPADTQAGSNKSFERTRDR